MDPNVKIQPRRLGTEGPLVSPIAFGGMLLSISGRPPEDQGIAVINAALDAGITLIDTADAYCIDERDHNHNEKLIAKAFRRRGERVLVATKCGMRRPGGAWTVDARPSYLKEAVHQSLDALSVNTLDLLQLHAPDSRVPFADSVGALAELKNQGKVRFVGLSNVTVAQIEEARRIVPIVSVQNRWNVTDRRSELEGVLDYCTEQGIAFFAYSPFGGTLGAPSLGTFGKLGEEARRRRMSPYRLILAWMLAKSPVAIPVPGARRVESIVDSAAAAAVQLSPNDVKAVEAAFRAT
jgi:aryl-alcohol dehydrogenase-like predicted oxidoreductase